MKREETRGTPGQRDDRVRGSQHQMAWRGAGSCGGGVVGGFAWLRGWRGRCGRATLPCGWGGTPHIRAGGAARTAARRSGSISFSNCPGAWPGLNVAVGVAHAPEVQQWWVRTAYGESRAPGLSTDPLPHYSITKPG